MQRSSGPRLLPIFIVLVVIAIVVVAVVSIGRAFFSNSQQTSSDTDNGRKQLLLTTASHSVRMTVRGPIVADENFKSYTIDVSPNARTMNVYKGYIDEVENSSSLANNEKGYEEFVYALDKANMMKGSVPTDDSKNDLRGICASGYVYEYSVLVNDQLVKKLWTSSCSGSKGTLQASTSQLNDLFWKQVPDYSKLNPFKRSGLPLSF